MPDTLTRAQRSERMSRIRGRDTGPEKIVKRVLRKMNVYFSTHARDLPGCPDFVFRRRRKVIFVHGCFWHRHPSISCTLTRLPKSRLEFWSQKLGANRTRDIRNQRRLHSMKWKFLIVWECKLRDKEQLENRIRRFLGVENAGD
jgi:DNA mismatch endonuclease (patch repair protein)